MTSADTQPKIIYQNQKTTIRVVLYSKKTGTAQFVVKKATSERGKKTLSRESNMLALIGTHECIVHVLANSPGKNVRLRYYGRGTLEDAWIASKGPLPLSRVRRYARRILRALVFLKKCGVVHRDVAPKNMLIDETDSIVLADFGYAHSGPVTRHCGTPFFWSPECFHTVVRASFEVDVWALVVSATSAALFARNMWSYCVPRLRGIRELGEQVRCAGYVLPRGTDHVFAAWIDAVLNPERNKRLSAKQALLHPFFSEHESG